MKAVFEKVLANSRESFVCEESSHPVFDCSYHFHPEIELTYIVSGYGIRFVGNHVGNFQAGDLVLHGVNLPHMYINDEEDSQSANWARSIVIKFREDCFGSRFFELPELRKIGELLSNASRGVFFEESVQKQASPLILNVLNTSEAGSVRYFLELFELLATSEAYQFLCEQSYQPALRRNQETRIDKVCQFINGHHEESITQEQVAGLVNMSPPAFSRFFRKATGSNFSHFLNSVRLEKACRQLRESDETVLTICHQSGFSNLSNFNRRFKDYVKMTPRDYRKRFRESI